MRHTIIDMITLLLFATIPPLLACPFPPEYWCSHDQIAKMCGVETQCQAWAKANIDVKDLEPEPEPTPSHQRRPWTLQDVELTNSVDGVDAAAVDADNDRRHALKVTLLYETLCPDCQQFVAGQLAPAFNELGNDFIRRVHLTMLPFGNAQETFNAQSGMYAFECQHGKAECLGNLVHVCAMNVVMNHAKLWFPFVHCMELKVQGKGRNPDIIKIGQECAQQNAMNWTEISECVHGYRGNIVQHAVAKATPSHQYVPWIIVNDIHTEDMQEAAEKDFLHFLCKFFHHPKPFACYKHLRGSPRCYVNFGSPKS